MLQDIRFFVRQALQHPGFVLTAVISLALGIGATTAVFSVIYAGLLHPYPYRDAQRIIRVQLQTKAVPQFFINFDGEQVRQLRQLPIVETLFAMFVSSEALTGSDVPQAVQVVRLNSTGFNDLGVPPLIGRGLLPSDAPDGQDPQPVAVLSYKFWREHFLSDPGVLGKNVEIDRKQYSIIGVAAPRFTWYNGDVFVPLKLGPDQALGDIVKYPGETGRDCRRSERRAGTAAARIREGNAEALSG